MKTEKERILAKIQKCLNLSKSSNPNEAAQALKQAHALMRKHNIDAGVVNDCSEIAASEKLQATRTEKMPEWVAILIDSVQDTFCVKALIHRQVGYWDRVQYRTQVQFYGNKNDVAIAEYAFNFLLRLLKKHRADYYANLKSKTSYKPSKLTVMADNYAKGWVMGVHSEMADLRPYKGDAYVEQEKKAANYIKEVHGKLDFSEHKKSKFEDVSSMRAGYADGKEVEINRGVTAPDQQNMLAYALQ